MYRAILYVVSLTMLLGACRSEPTKPTTTVLQLMQDKNSFSASLVTTMTFDDHGTSLFSPTECSVKNVPIAWTGNVFTGWAFESTDNQTVLLVRGRLSEDGSWIDSLSFSIKNIGQARDRIEFEVAVRYVPIADVGSGVPRAVGIFEKVDDVRKHVESVKYTKPGIQHISTEWTNANGVFPSLSVRLERVVFDTPQPGVGCPCEW